MQYLYKMKNVVLVGPTDVRAPAVVITPGINSMPEEDWASIKKHPDISRLISQKNLIAINGDDDKQLHEVYDISERDSDEVKEWVANTLSINTLQAFRAQEEKRIDGKRTDVLEVINSQIQRLN